MRILSWVAIATLTLIVEYLAFHFGIFNLVYQYDFTRISFLIVGCYGAGLVMTGICVFSIRDLYVTLGHRMRQQFFLRVSKFISNHMLTLGMIGTVIGMIYILHTCFGEIDIRNVATAQQALTQMSSGMGTAFITTAVGLIHSLFLKILLLTVETE